MASSSGMWRKGVTPSPPSGERDGVRGQAQGIGFDAKVGVGERSQGGARLRRAYRGEACGGEAVHRVLNSTSTGCPGCNCAATAGSNVASTRKTNLARLSWL